jgi:hypothetical protein
MRSFLGWVIIVLCMCTEYSIARGADTCGSCVVPCRRASDETFTVRLTGGRVDPLQGFTHIIRDTIRIGGELVQAYRCSAMINGRCADTLLLADHTESIVLGNTLGKTPPLYVPLRPVAEYTVVREPHSTTSFAEVGGMLAYGGSDSSATPKIGFNGFYYGAEALVAPFGDLLGSNTALAVGGGVLMEGGRMRFPLLAHLRFSFSSADRVQRARYVPSACSFQCEPLRDTVAAPDGAVRRPGSDSVDRSAILVRETVLEYPEHAPYVFVEGGPVLNGSFDGAGARPSINPDDYGQFVLGAGAGIPVLSWLHAQLAYRYARLNLRTPCVDCQDVYQVNTNNVHAVVLRIFLHWGW